MEQSTTMPVIPGPDAPDADEALVSFGIATAVRDAAICVGIVLGLLYLFPILRLVISDAGWHRRLQRIAPMTVGAKPHASAGLNTLSISPWADLSVLAAAAAAALMVGSLLLRFRDV
jgi:ABC-2 type transport system permease protein